MTIGARILVLLKERGITQKSLAEACNITPSTVNTWIKTDAESIPSSYILPISKVLGISADELLGCEPVPVVQEVIPDGYIHLDETEKKLIAILRELDWESQIVVMNAAVAEKRSNSAQGDNSVAASAANVG